MLYWIFDLDETLYQSNPKIGVKEGLYLDYSFLHNDKKLKILLQYLQGHKLIMTNAIQKHCHHVLHRLDIKDCFHHIYHRNLTNALKPHPRPYLQIMKELKINKKDMCIFFDDMPVNLIMAKKFGWTTVLITPNPWRYYEGHHSIDFVFPRVHNAIAFFLSKIPQRK